MKTVKMSERTYTQYIKFLNDKKKKKKPLNKMDKILIIILITVISFIISMIVLFAKYRSVPDSLIVGFFGMVSGEVSILGIIKNRLEKNKCSQAESLESEE